MRGLRRLQAHRGRAARRRARAFLDPAHNADYCTEYLTHVRDLAKGYMSVPFAEDVELSMRVG